MKTILAMAMRVGSAAVSPSLATNPAHLKRIDEWRRCSDCDLTGANLMGANLQHVYLNGSSLNNANLSGADLSGAFLKATDLSWANLSGADLSGAYLEGADLTEADITGANLSNAQLCKTIMPDKRVNNSGCR